MCISLPEHLSGNLNLSQIFLAFFCFFSDFLPASQLATCSNWFPPVSDEILSRQTLTSVSHPRCQWWYVMSNILLSCQYLPSREFASFQMSHKHKYIYCLRVTDRDWIFLKSQTVNTEIRERSKIFHESSKKSLSLKFLHILIQLVPWRIILMSKCAIILICILNCENKAR